MAPGGEELLALHEAVGMIVDLEQDLMDAHLKAIQVRRAGLRGGLPSHCASLFFFSPPPPCPTRA